MMNKLGLVRVAAVSPITKVGDINFNIDEILKAIRYCITQNVNFVVFPELCITSYTCADLFGQQILLNAIEQAVNQIRDITLKNEIIVIVGAPVPHNNGLYNCALVISHGKVNGISSKTHIPEYGEFYEKRWFKSADTLAADSNVQCNYYPFTTVPIGNNLIFEFDSIKFAIEICEDLWVPNPVSSRLAEAGAEIIFNLSATNELIGKHHYLVDLIKNQSARCRCAYVYASAGAGESSTDLAFAGNCIIADNGKILRESERFTFDTKIEIADIDIENLRHDRLHFTTFTETQKSGDMRMIYIDPELSVYTDDRVVTKFIDGLNNPQEGDLKYFDIDPTPFVDKDPQALQARCDEISSIQAWGLATRLKAIRCNKAVIGISGGLDSTLALLVTVKAFDMLGLDRKGIIGITMPGFGTTDRTKNNASELMALLGVTQREIRIADAVNQHFKDIGHDGTTPDVTYENSQARERTQILMDIANMENAIVIGTGDLSELALGWCTYNGDQMSMYGVNSSIPKTLVKYLVEGYAYNSDNDELKRTLHDIVDTPISPELLPADTQGNIKQKTEDLVGPYELHDFFMYHILRHGSEPLKIYTLAKKAFDGKYESATILHWLKTFYRRFFNQQFKRSCMPDGVKVGSVSLSPRGDWRMPSDASSALWLSQLEKIEPDAN